MKVTARLPIGDGAFVLAPDAVVSVGDDVPLKDEAGRRVGTVKLIERVADGFVIEAELDG